MNPWVAFAELYCTVVQVVCCYKEGPTPSGWHLFKFIVVAAGGRACKKVGICLAPMLGNLVILIICIQASEWKKSCKGTRLVQGQDFFSFQGDYLLVYFINILLHL